MQNPDPKLGKLYVVATPIGNMQDMTLRAIETLKQVDKIVAEDTRHAAPLLKHFSIEKPMISMHEFNERERMDMVVDFILEGQSVALISDAGTPLISDPGFRLVRQAKANQIPVLVIPGPCAAIAALSVAGLPSDRFLFEGFLPAKDEARKQYLMRLLHEPRTLIFYEAPHRLLSSLQTMKEVFGGERSAVVARELTKMHESVILNTLNELVSFYEGNPGKLKGEIVILVEGGNETSAESKEVVPEEVLDILLEELPLKQAVSLASKITGVRKNEMYEEALKKKS